jgi:hypothetical protein
MKPEPKTVTLTVYQDDGIEKFLQAMCNRRAFGSVRYAESHPAGSTPAEDHAHSAGLSIWAALEFKVSERFVDAAVYCFLAWRNAEGSPPLDGDSPGVIQGRQVKLARGRWAGFNGLRWLPGTPVTPGGLSE